MTIIRYLVLLDTDFSYFPKTNETQNTDCSHPTRDRPVCSAVTVQELIWRYRGVIMATRADGGRDSSRHSEAYRVAYLRDSAENTTG